MTLKFAEIESLITLSEKLDEDGKTQESAALYATAQKLIKAAEEEEKEAKGPRQMSAKAKTKFRAVKKAAESLIASDLDYRGPYKSSCRKVEMLCEEILEALKECHLDD
jgi:hypothetical protein